MKKVEFVKEFKNCRHLSSFVIIKLPIATFYADNYYFDKKHRNQVVFSWRDSEVGYCDVENIYEVL